MLVPALTSMHAKHSMGMCVSQHAAPCTAGWSPDDYAFNLPEDDHLAVMKLMQATYVSVRQGIAYWLDHCTSRVL